MESVENCQIIHVHDPFLRLNNKSPTFWKWHTFVYAFNLKYRSLIQCKGSDKVIFEIKVWFSYAGLSADINEIDLENEVQYDSEEFDDEATYRDDSSFVYKKHAGTT